LASKDGLRYVELVGRIPKLCEGKYKIQQLEKRLKSWISRVQSRVLISVCCWI